MKTSSECPGLKEQPVRPDVCLDLLWHWAAFAECDWHGLSVDGSEGCYGTGYDSWGVQTNQKYLACMAILACDDSSSSNGCDRQWALDRARAALRFSLNSHTSGTGSCRDGKSWGNTWISALGIERMMLGVQAMQPHLTQGEHDALRRVLCNEADWLLNDPLTGRRRQVAAGLWNGRNNVPESNLWKGALLWRTATRYPSHRHADDWREQAHRHLVNALSIPEDAVNTAVLEGKTVRERFEGANFFSNYALDHHGYLNIGYMIICISNAAILHFDLKQSGLPRPATLDHHQDDLWRVARTMILDDGRLIRIGGDSRVRYCYCQDYMPAAAYYAADRWNDATALTPVAGQIQFVKQECDFNGDGSFLSRRLPEMAAGNPYYYARLESDRALSMAMIAAYAGLLNEVAGSEKRNEAAENPRETTAVWHDPDHGAALHRCPTRLASFSWRAHEQAQGMNLPPANGHIAEWPYNLAGRARFLGDNGQTGQRQLERHEFTFFPGGFLTWGMLREGMELSIPEGWHGSHTAEHQIVFAALPDAHTVLGMQLCKTGARWDYLIELAGMHLNIPNDLFNSFTRKLFHEGGVTDLVSPADEDLTQPLDSRWVNIDNCIGASGLYGADSLTLDRVTVRRGGAFKSLYVDRIGFPYFRGLRETAPSETVIDAGWASLANVDHRLTRKFANDNRLAAFPSPETDVRILRIKALDGHEYLLAASFAEKHPPIDIEALLPAGQTLKGLAGETPACLAPKGALLYRIARTTIVNGTAARSA